MQTNLPQLLRVLSEKYPSELVESQLRDIPRIADHICLVLNEFPGKKPNEISLCDIGGGLGLFSLGCAALGFRRVLLVDDFRDKVNADVGDDALAQHKALGIEILSRDVIEDGLQRECAGITVITSFHSMEHWHHSPKRLFRGVVESMDPLGLFLLCGPNCANLRKRATAWLGRNKWSFMEDWYDSELFRGHVREPDVDDLRYIARDLKLREVQIVGRNWQGHHSTKPWIRSSAVILDRALRPFPSLCSDIYLLGRPPRPAAVG